MSEIARHFCTSATRVKLFRGLVDFRKALIGIGITEGIQWIDGSYLENVEVTRKQPPKDIDIVTLFVRPVALRGSLPAWTAFFNANKALFDRLQTKAKYGVDASPIDVGLPAFQVYSQITYWYSLFTHQRVSYLWKGILAVQLVGDDDDALAYVDTLTFPQ